MKGLEEQVEAFEHFETPTGYGGSVKILFVEDNEADMELVRRSLGRAHVSNKFEHVSTGDAAWERLQDKSKPLPDWIFIDRVLHGGNMTGDELVEKIHKEEDLRKCEVIVLSAASLREDEEERFLKLGVSVYFPKPLTIRNILDMIETSKNWWIDIYRKRAQVA